MGCSSDGLHVDEWHAAEVFLIFSAVAVVDGPSASSLDDKGVAGGGREIIRLIGYGIEQKTQRERDRLIAQNPEAAAALNANPISKPPSVGPLAVLLPLAMVTGAAAGPMVRPAVEVATSAAECRKNSDCGSGCT
jgi:hypothetical protein